MKFHDIQQNTDEWFELRGGLATSSNFGTIMANEGKAFGNPAIKYAVRLAFEQKYNELAPQYSYTNKFMEDGHLYEPIARDKYEEQTFNNVTNGGFFTHETMKVGGSPDGCIMLDNGGVEIKSVIYTTQRDTVKRGKFDPSYKWQIHGNIWLGNMDYMDFISYCPILKPPNDLFIDRVERDDEMINRLIFRLNEFQKLVEEQKQYV